MSDTDHNHILNVLAQPSQGPAAADMRIIERSREIAAGSLSGALKGMLERLADEFFMLAEKAVQLDTQHLYFEAMSIVRDQRDRIEQGFRKHFILGFNSAVRADSGTSNKHANFDDEGEFDLVDADELEESIAIQEMTAKMKGTCHDELFALEKRMGVLLHDPEMRQHKNPLGVEVLANAFISACGESDARLKVRLLLVTMWDRQMQNGVLSTYHEVNQYLVEKDILPKIKRDIKRQEMSQVEQIASAAAHAAVQALSMTEEDGDVFETMRHLMHAAAMRSGLTGLSGGIGVPGTATSPSGSVEGAQPAPVAVAHNPLLLSQLTQLQHGVAATISPGAMGDAGMLVLGHTNVLRDLKSSELAPALGSADAMTIDIVSMLFDFIFDDQRVPDPIKALLGRLQIPVLKAAMLDQAFFSKKSHPTRRLLNVMAEAANGWGAEIGHDSPLYLIIDTIVQRINTEFESDMNVFVQALDTFERFLQEREHAADALVEVSIDMIEAREREQIKEEDAQAIAEDAVRARAMDNEVPETVRLFLCQEWIKPLRTAFIASGAESHAWLAAIGLMDDLIWSVRPKLTRESRQYMVKTLPGLLRRLQEGMLAADIAQPIRDQFMSQLVHCHAAAVKAGFQATAEPQSDTEEAWKSAVLARQASNQGQESAIVLPFARPDRAPDNGQVKLEIIKAQAGQGKLEVEEITIGSVAWSEADNFEDSAEPQPEAALTAIGAMDGVAAKHAVAELRPGVWVEFCHDGEEALLAKLKWISPLKSAYLFTDRQGKRAATMPLDKLEAAFRIGSARIIDELPLLDRAVDNVIETLKQAAA